MAHNSLEHIAWFRASAPYINAYRGKTFVVYLPGESLLHANFSTIIQDLALLHSLGIRLVLVHGSRPQINERLNKENIASEFYDNERVTDESSIPYVLQAVGESRFLVESALSTGLPNSPMHGSNIKVVTGNFVVGMPKGVHSGVDFHFTGQVRKIESSAINNLLANQAIVLISPIGYSITGEVFNLPSADLAIETAISLQADKFIYFTEQAGLILSNGELIHQLGLNECQSLISDPTVENDTAKQILTDCFKVADKGVARAQIISYCENGSLLEELFTTNGRGTLVHRDSYEVIRQATIDDVGGILALITPLEQQGVLVRRSRELLESEITQFSVIEIDNLVIGCAALYDFGDSDCAELAALTTHPEYQGQGMGAKLLLHIEHSARALGFKRIFVLTTQTAHWFLANGFSPGDLNQLPEQKQSLYNLQRRSKIFVKVL